MGGAAARAPVAMTALLNRSVRPATAIVSGSVKLAIAKEDIDAQVAEPSRRIVPADAGAQLAHPLHRGPEIRVPPVGHVHSELTRVSDGGCDPSGTDDGLRRDAAVVEAIAAQQVPLDQRDPGSQSRRTGCGHQAGRSRTDHDQVVSRGRFGIGPVGGVDVVDKRSVVHVVREDLFQQFLDIGFSNGRLMSKGSNGALARRAADSSSHAPVTDRGRQRPR